MAKEKNTEETVIAAAKSTVTDSEMAEIRENTARELNKQPKRTVRLRKDPHPKAPNYETVQINGYTYQIQKGVDVEVPDEVYQILVRAGLY